MYIYTIVSLSSNLPFVPLGCFQILTIERGCKKHRVKMFLLNGILALDIYAQGYINDKFLVFF